MPPAGRPAMEPSSRSLCGLYIHLVRTSTGRRSTCHHNTVNDLYVRAGHCLFSFLVRLLFYTGFTNAVTGLPCHIRFPRCLRSSPAGHGLPSRRMLPVTLFVPTCQRTLLLLLSPVNSIAEPCFSSPETIDTHT